MLSGLSKIFRPKARREHCVRQLVAAVNSADYAGLDELLTEDFTFADVHGGTVSGRDAFIREDRRFRDAAGSPTLVLESLDHNGEEVLVSGHLDGGIEEVTGPTMWRIRFRGQRMAHVEVTRAMSHITMPAFASRGDLTVS